LADDNERRPGIGQLNERSLHASLKEWYSEPGDEFEVPVDRFVVDIVRDDMLIEIQTRNFSAIKRKLRMLLDAHHVRLVHPIAREKWLIKLPKTDEDEISRRKSPKRGRFADLFRELVYVPGLAVHDGFELEVLLTMEEEVRRHDPRRAWRRKGWVTDERRLLDVTERQVFVGSADYVALLPETLPEEFTTADIAESMSVNRRLAQQTAYCLRAMGAIESVGKRANAVLYRRIATS
jgi:hypothetical protein